MTVKKRRNRFLLCGSGSSGTVSPRSSSSNSSSTSSTSSGYVRIRLGFSTRLKIFFRRILSRFRSNRKTHPNRRSSISLVEDRSLSIIMELPEHLEPSIASETQIAPSPQPFSPSVHDVIQQLSERRSMSCSSRGMVQSVWCENESVSPTSGDLSPQPSSISSLFDIASPSPEAPEETLVNQQICLYDQPGAASSESMKDNKVYCRNENAKQQENPTSLMSSTVAGEPLAATGAVVEKTNGSCTDTMKIENKLENKSVQFQNNVLVYPSPPGGVDAKSSGRPKTVECLSDCLSEGLRVGEDGKAKRPATPGKLLSAGETTASPNSTSTPMNDGKKTSVTVKDPDYTPRTPRDKVKTENDKGRTPSSLPQCSALGELYAEDIGNSSSLDDDVPSEVVCAKRSWSRLDISTAPTNDDGFRTNEKDLFGKERNEKERKNISDEIDTDRQELEDKARRRADRKKRKEMRMAAEGYIKGQENPPHEEKQKKKSKKKENIQKNTAIDSDEAAGLQEYRHESVIRLEAERDTSNTPQEGSHGNTTFTDKLQHWEKLKVKGDIRSLDGQEETYIPVGKTRTKKKKNRELPAAGDEGMGTMKEKRKGRTQIKHEEKKENIGGSGEEVSECIEPMEEATYQQKITYSYNRSTEDTVSKHSAEDEAHTYPEDHSKIEQTDTNFQKEIGKEKLSQEERRKRRAKRKKIKEAIAAGKENSFDKRNRYPGDQVMTQMSREDHDNQRGHITDQDKIEGIQHEIAENLGLSSNSDKVQRNKQGMVDCVSNVPVHSESSKMYVEAGVGPTHSEDISQKSVHVSKTKPVDAACGERQRKSSNKKRENRDSSTSDEVISTYAKGHKQSPGGQLIDQQYSNDPEHFALHPEEERADQTIRYGEFSDVGGADFHRDLLTKVPPWAPGKNSRLQDRVQTQENYLMMAEQGSSLETPGIGGNGKGYFTEGDATGSSKYQMGRDPSNKVNITARDVGHISTAPTTPESEEDRPRELDSSHQEVKDHQPSVTEQDRPRPVGCDVDINLGREMKPGLESAVRRMNQKETFSGSISRPESRSLWSTSTMSIPHSIQEEDETEESEDQTGQDPSDTTQDEDKGEEQTYIDTGQDNHIKYPAPGPREELAPNVFKVDKMNLPPVCVVQKEDGTKSVSLRKPGHSTIQTGQEKDSYTEDVIPQSKQLRVDDFQSKTSPELDDFFARYSDLKSDVEGGLIPEQTWEEITKPIGQFRPKARVQGEKTHLTAGAQEPSITDQSPTVPPANLNRKQRAHYEKLQVTFRAQEKNLPGAQFWKDLNADKLGPEAVPQDLFIKTPFGQIFPNECEDQQMSPIKAYRDDHNHQSGGALDETGYESMEQSENYDNSPETLSDLRNKLRKICGEEVESDPHPQSPPGGMDMNEVSTDPRFWKSHESPRRDSSRLSAEVLSRIANCAEQDAEVSKFADENSSYQDEQFHEEYKEPSFAPSLIDRYHSKKDENLDFFRCVSRGSLNSKQTLRTEEENIARSLARTDSREHTVDNEMADGNLLFFKTVARYPAFYEQETETTDSKVVKSRCGRKSPGYIPDDPSNYISGEVAHQNLEFFRAVARDTSFFKLPDKRDQGSEDSEEDSTTPRNRPAADPTQQKDDKTSHHKDRSHHHRRSQNPASKVSNRFQHKTLEQDHLDSERSGPPNLSKWYSKRMDGLGLLQPVVSPGKAKENMDFFLQVSKDPHFYKIADKPEVPEMVAPDNKPRSYKTYKGINVNSGRAIGKQGLGFKSRLN